MKKYHKIETVFKRDTHGLDVVPLVQVKTIDQAIKYVKTKPISSIGKKIKEIEGVVGTPAQRLLDVKGNRIVVKIKVRDFE